MQNDDGRADGQTARPRAGAETHSWKCSRKKRRRMDHLRHQRRCTLLTAHVAPTADGAASFASGLVSGLVLGGGVAAVALLNRQKTQPAAQSGGLGAPIPQPSSETFGVPMGPDQEIYQCPVSLPRVGQSQGAFEYTRAMLDDGIHNTRTLGHSSKLEEGFCARFNHKYGILYANGTATLHGALLGAGVGIGDEVIVPSFTPFP